MEIIAILALCTTVLALAILIGVLLYFMEPRKHNRS